MSDALYFDDRRVGSYVKMTAALNADIRAGTLRL